jgi:nitrite reductase (NADH) small subunit/3-phenylpropionate/trans-cinnamate dioxygenase ferredoxin subunit
MSSDFIPIAKIADLPPGTCTSFETGEYGIALCNVDGRIYALDNTCPHAGGPLGEGTLDGEHIACPWHGWKFHVSTGVCQKNPSPSWNVACYEVRVVNDIIQVALPAQHS